MTRACWDRGRAERCAAEAFAPLDRAELALGLPKWRASLDPQSKPCCPVDASRRGAGLKTGLVAAKQAE